MMQAPEEFKAGVSGAPVTDWRLYDTHYTERYMSTPSANADGYDVSNVLSHVEQLRGPLLIIHGMADDNVLLNHSTLLFPGNAKEGHFIREHDVSRRNAWFQRSDIIVHRARLIMNFFDRHLKVVNH